MVRTNAFVLLCSESMIYILIYLIKESLLYPQNTIRGRVENMNELRTIYHQIRIILIEMYNAELDLGIE